MIFYTAKQRSSCSSLHKSAAQASSVAPTWLVSRSCQSSGSARPSSGQTCTDAGGGVGNRHVKRTGHGGRRSVTGTGQIAATMSYPHRWSLDRSGHTPVNTGRSGPKLILLNCLTGSCVTHAWWAHPEILLQEILCNEEQEIAVSLYGQLCSCGRRKRAEAEERRIRSATTQDTRRTLGHWPRIWRIWTSETIKIPSSTISSGLDSK
jgi:hypothetical protein